MKKRNDSCINKKLNRIIYINHLFKMNFDPVDEKDFDRYIDTQYGSVDLAADNFCPDCNVPVILSGVERSCPKCGLTSVHTERSDTIIHSNIKRSAGGSKGKFYATNNDYTKTQRKTIINQLLVNNKYREAQSDGSPFPKNILTKTAEQYNGIQQIVEGQKKFVRRGDIKNEILAALIYFNCIKEGISRKRKDCATFMGLEVEGISRGESILRELCAEGKINIEMEEESVSGYAERYVEALGLDGSYIEFIIDLVNSTEELHIGMNSQISSKVVGAIRIVIQKKRLAIADDQIEKATDNTKKNTFNKFYKTVFDNIESLSDVFSRHNIPYN